MSGRKMDDVFRPQLKGKPAVDVEPLRAVPKPEAAEERVKARQW